MKTPEQMAEEYERFNWCVNGLKSAFLAGYQAAKDQLADFSKVMCNTTMEEIKAVDTGELMPITNLPTSAKWISVKDRLPEDWDCVLWLAGTDGRFECGWEKNECANSACKTGCGQGFGAGAVFICEFHRKDKHHEQHYLIDDNNDIAFIDCFTHWMPLPAAPKGGE